MTNILIVDAQQNTRLNLQFELVHSGQFERVLACDNLEQAEQALSRCAVQVMLLAASLNLEKGDWQHITDHHSTLGLVLVHENGAFSGTDFKPPVHAHIQRTGSVMDWVASIAKALVACRVDLSAYKKW